ncbi:hypothetical protein [Fodinibius salsisoli]|uniref:thiopurine S-methyltransferase n=1 Tax=Fodinibius salsisoli TaxID=2820877 RepID=A0ABT3PSB4_9BACT|nr:hypothetical protein [Fodinibius salsisoli]MCW9708737.1 hypothetical protein [Fodinibius salsisoli]
MEISYWKSRWRKGNIGWHMDHVFPPLTAFWSALALAEGTTVLVPLCGKSPDLQWLADLGHKVVGVEASGKAIKEFIAHSPESFTRTERYGYPIFESPSITLWQGNFLSLPTQATGPLDAIYDKASLVALPPDTRPQYAHKLLQLCGSHTQLFLQTFEYEQEEMNGPPFSVPLSEVQTLFGNHFTIRLLQEESRLAEVQKFQQRGLSSHFVEKIYHLYTS